MQIEIFGGSNGKPISVEIAKWTASSLLRGMMSVSYALQFIFRLFNEIGHARSRYQRFQIAKTLRRMKNIHEYFRTIDHTSNELILP